MRGKLSGPADFWALVERRGLDDCWLWTGTENSGGYGGVSYRKQKWNAHRLAWFLERGDPGALMVLHRCDNRLCCNLRHLFLGTHAENMKDMVRKGRSLTGDRNVARRYRDRVRRGEQHGLRLHPECVARGEALAQAKLTEGTVRQLRSLSLKGWTHSALAKKFGVSRRTVGMAIARRTWAHVA